MSGERADEVRRWQRGVQEEADAGLDALFAEQRRQRDQVVVVHPDEVVVAHHGRQSAGEASIDSLVHAIGVASVVDQSSR